MARHLAALVLLGLVVCSPSPSPAPTPTLPAVAVTDDAVPVAAASVAPTPSIDLLNGSAVAATAEEVAQAARGLNLFGAAVTRTLYQKRGNVIFAPPSLAMVLGMLATGASGPSRDRLGQALAFALPAERQHLALAALGRRWSRFDKPRLTVALANQLFGNRAVAFRPELLAGLREIYGAETTLLDFSRPEEAAATVNAWIGKQTRGRIKDTVSADLFAPDPLPIAVVLANALYFRGRWQDEFYPPVTTRRNFWIDGTHAARVPLMQSEGDYLWARRPTFSALEIDYQGGQFSMVVILPHEQSGLAAVEQECLRSDLGACAADLRQRYVQLRLPRFRVETEAYSLKPALKALGLAGLFSPRGEQFANLVADGTPVYLRDVVQKVFVAVDEKGTEAAAATVGVGGTGDMPPKPVKFFVNRPFLFFIRDRATGVVLFVGRITDPR